MAEEQQLEDVVLQRTPPLAPDAHDAPGGSNEEACTGKVWRRGGVL